MLILDGYSLKDYTCTEGNNGYIQTGKLVYNGSVIANFEDKGDGGGMIFDGLPKNIKSHNKNVKEVYKGFEAYNDYLENDETAALEFLVNTLAEVNDVCVMITKQAESYKDAKPAVVILSVEQEMNGETYNRIYPVAFLHKKFTTRKNIEAACKKEGVVFKKLLGNIDANEDSEIFSD